MVRVDALASTQTRRGLLMTPARWALLTALALLAVGALTAALLIPWDASVAPWADLSMSDALADFTEGQRDVIAAYVNAAWLPGLLATLAGPVMAFVVLLAPSMRRWLASIGPAQRQFLRTFLAAATLLTLVRLAAFPFDLWLAAVRRDNALLVESWTAWLLRWAATSGVTVLLGAVAVAVVLALLRRLPRSGWVLVVAGAGVVAVVGSLAVPLLSVVDGTRSAPALRDRVMAIAESTGVDVGDVVVIDVADRSPVINAQVSGWGPTRTVTLYDTLLDTATPAEVDALVAHELIHVRENDVLLGTALAVIGTMAALAVGCALLLSARVQRRLSARGPGDGRLVPLLAAVVMGASLVSLPLAATLSRPLEVRADREAIAITGDPASYASLMRLLTTTNKSTLEPPRWRYALLFTHPTPLQRIGAAGRSS